MQLIDHKPNSCTFIRALYKNPPLLGSLLTTHESEQSTHGPGACGGVLADPPASVDAFPILARTSDRTGHVSPTSDLEWQKHSVFGGNGSCPNAAWHVKLIMLIGMEGS